LKTSKIFACGAENGKNLSSRFYKLHLIFNEEIWLKNLPKFSKFLPTAQKRPFALAEGEK